MGNPDLLKCPWCGDDPRYVADQNRRRTVSGKAGRQIGGRLISHYFGNSHRRNLTAG
jgi:hypothetical protein